MSFIRSLEGFTVINPVPIAIGINPGDRKASKTTVRAETGIEKQLWLRTE